MSSISITNAPPAAAAALLPANAAAAQTAAAKDEATESPAVKAQEARQSGRPLPITANVTSSANSNPNGNFSKLV